MSDYQIRLKPVYSQTVTAPEGLVLPTGWNLAWHQLATLEALRDPNIDVVVNTAMTGDGKSLAAYLEALQDSSTCAIGLYPTNELGRDQEIQVNDYIAKFPSAKDLRVNRLNGAELEMYAAGEKLGKAAAILTKSSQSEVLITNPDIFHYLHRGAYIINGKKGDSPDKLWNKIDKDFDLFIFDEFHVYSAPQVASVINTLLLIRATNRKKKFLFLSATPEPQLIQRIEKAGLSYRIIDPIKQQKYQFPSTRSTEAELNPQEWRQVARAIDLNFISLEPAAKASETWLKDNAESILAYFQQHPGSKGSDGRCATLRKC